MTHTGNRKIGTSIIAGIVVTCILAFSLLFGGVMALVIGVPCALPGLPLIASAITGGNESKAVTDYFAQFKNHEEHTEVERRANAALIVKIGHERGFSNNSIAIAVATAIQESNLANLGDLGAKNDHNSRGLFQQQLYMNWGTEAQIMDPSFATNTFYDRLAGVADRDSRPMIDVAIQIQIPSKTAYHRDWKWDNIAAGIVASQPTGHQTLASTLTCAPEASVGVAADGWRLPLDPGYKVMAIYGPRVPPPLFGVNPFHKGYDLALPQGAPVYAITDGVITSARPLDTYTKAQTYGNYLIIDHGGGVESLYAHLSAYGNGIVSGKQVKVGDVIGRVGTSGASSGNHLHFEVRVGGKAVNPGDFMVDKGLELQPGITKNMDKLVKDNGLGIFVPSQ